MCDFMNEKELERDLKVLKCPCGGLMKQTKVKLYGFQVRAWKCDKCKEITVDTIESDRARVLNKLREKPLVLKAGEMTDSTYIRFPKEYSMLVPLGSKVEITPKGEKEFILKIKS
ncbi:hypothetical protein A3K63_04045 [Candidatus Micrarchaeota archaeon RBG_16_49_10]|nr:MAG: hypothetical protein A3K63_04045 [Candidatus Micrarchaeota archaeon RBG_16_49_10]